MCNEQAKESAKLEYERNEKYLWKIIAFFGSRQDFDKMNHDNQQKLIRDLRDILKEFKNGES